MLVFLNVVNSSKDFVSFSMPFYTEWLKLSTDYVQCLSSLGATQSVVLVPSGNYTVFQNDTPVIFYCYGSGSAASWILNGTGYSLEHAQRGITFIVDSPTGTTISSRLIIPSNSTINNTIVMCKTADITFSNVLTSQLATLTIQGECCTIP